jgi:hypothetical protein
MPLLRRPGQHVALAAVLAVLAVGMVIVALGHVRQGVGTLALAVWLGAGLRGLLPAGRIGLLAVRTRRLDLLVLMPLATALSVLAVILPVRP